MKKSLIIAFVFLFNLAHAVGDFSIPDSIFFWLFKLPLGIIFFIFIIFMFFSINSVEDKELKEKSQKDQNNKNTQ